MKNLTLCLVALLLLCRGASPDDRVKPVTLTLIVTDHHGNPVTDLRASDLRRMIRFRSRSRNSLPKLYKVCRRW